MFLLYGVIFIFSNLIKRWLCIVTVFIVLGFPIVNTYFRGFTPNFIIISTPIHTKTSPSLTLCLFIERVPQTTYITSVLIFWFRIDWHKKVLLHDWYYAYEVSTVWCSPYYIIWLISKSFCYVHEVSSFLDEICGKSVHISFLS